MVCYYWFFNHRFKYKDSVWNDCHDLSMQYVNISDIAIIIVKGANYLCIIHGISKSEANNFLEILCLMIVGIYNMPKKSILKIKSTTTILTIWSKQKN